MKSTTKLLIVSALALMIAAPAAFAQTPIVSTLPVTERLDVGGTILEPGTYQIRVITSGPDRNRVQITNTDQTKIYATLLTVPHQLEPNEEMPNTTFVYYPAGEGQPRALRTWFPADTPLEGGHDIVYVDSRARQLARLAKENVVYYEGELADNNDLHIITPDERVETYTITTVTPPPTPVIIATPPPAPMISQSTEPIEMPRTAGKLPLLALLGIAAVGGAVAVRAARS